MSTVYKSVSDIYFSNAGSGVQFQVDSTTFHSAKIITDISTSDANVSVSTTEILTQASGSVPAFATIVTTVSTIDTNVRIAVNPAVSGNDIDIVTVGSESVANGIPTTTMTSTVSLKTGDLVVYANSTVTDNTNSALQEPAYRYLILRHNLVDGMLHGVPGGDYNMTCQEMYSLMNVTCVKLSEGLYQTLRQGWVQETIIEIDADTAFYGTTFFSEIRPVAKIWEAKTSWYGEKTPTQITPEIVGYILKVMKAFATNIVESEYERRYLTLRNASMLETASWEIQKAEAKEWLVFQGADNHVTPFLDYLATQRSMDKTVLANKILTNAESHQDALSRLLVEMQTLVKKFNNCDSVWDINILYEDCLGIALPVKQAIDLGRTISADNWNRRPEWSVKGNGYYF